MGTDDKGSVWPPTVYIPTGQAFFSYGHCWTSTRETIANITPLLKKDIKIGRVAVLGPFHLGRVNGLCLHISQPWTYVWGMNLLFLSTVFQPALLSINKYLPLKLMYRYLVPSILVRCMHDTFWGLVLMEIHFTIVGKVLYWSLAHISSHCFPFQLCSVLQKC